MLFRSWNMQLATGIMAGVHGLPLYGLVSLIWKLMHDDDEDDFDMVAAKAMPDILLHGGLDATTGVAFSKRIGMSDLIFKDPMGAAGYTTFTQALGTALGGPVFSLGDRMVRGFSKIADGNIERGVEDLLPVAVTNVLMKAPRFVAEGGPRTLRGDTIGEVSIPHAILQGLGFTPADVSRRTEATAKMESVEQEVKHKVQNLKLRYYNGLRFHDREGAIEARRELLRYGKEHPEIGRAHV